MMIFHFREYCANTKNPFKGRLCLNSMEKTRLTVAGARTRYWILILPFILAFIIWLLFPVLAEAVIFRVFGYEPTFQPTSWLWHAVVFILYGWYTLIVIGIGGTFVVAAWLWRRRMVRRHLVNGSYPLLSFVVPAYNEERLISRCILSLFKCAAKYPARSEIIVVDDGSTDNTYEAAWSTIERYRRYVPQVSVKVVRHTQNLGRAEAVRSGVNKATMELVCVVDADSWWQTDTLSELFSLMEVETKIGAVTGYVHPTDGQRERNVFVVFQQQEYSQALAVFRCAQALKNSVFIVPGPIGLQEANRLRDVLNEKTVRSVTEDLEVTLQMHKRGVGVSYAENARCETIAPTSLRVFWNQRLRWFTGGLHNLLGIHRDMLFKRTWVSLFLWYTLIVEYGGAILEVAALIGLPLLYCFAPDRTFFLYNLLMFLLWVLIVGTIYQAIALKFAYNEFNHGRLLLYMPLYLVLRFVNVFARFTCLIKYAFGDRGSWRKAERPILG